ncbi:hypothetical protein V8C37DRAFT_396474 [Trichoderma ceciliae]
MARFGACESTARSLVPTIVHGLARSLPGVRRLLMAGYLLESRILWAGHWYRTTTLGSSSVQVVRLFDPRAGHILPLGIEGSPACEQRGPSLLCETLAAPTRQYS